MDKNDECYLSLGEFNKSAFDWVASTVKISHKSKMKVLADLESCEDGSWSSEAIFSLYLHIIPGSTLAFHPPIIH